MASNRARLSERELHELLERAIVREAQEGGQMPEATLAEIGQELGLDAAHVRDVLADHRARQRAADAGDVVERPFDTKVTLRSSPRALEIEIPGAGLKLGALATLCFAVPWLAFVGTWTVGMARQESVLAAFFSIPFWAVGLAFLYGALAISFGVTRIQLSRSGGVIDQRPFGRRASVDPRRLSAKLVTDTISDDDGRAATSKTYLVVEHGPRTWKLLGEHSDVERRWLQGELERWLAGP